MIGIVNANLLTNGDFQTGDATGWDNWNSITTDQDNSGSPLTGNGKSTPGGSGDFAAKSWGDGLQWGNGGFSQTVAATEGALYAVSAEAMHITGDELTNGGIGVLKLTFRDVADNPLNGEWGEEIAMITAASPKDIWHYLSGSRVAPVGTTQVEVIIMMQWLTTGPDGGAAFFDNVSLIIPKTAVLPNPPDGASVPPSTNELSWTNPDPNNPADTITCDVWLEVDDGDPNFHPGSLIAEGIEEEFVNLSDAGVTLLVNTTYTWRVDCTDPRADPDTGGPVTTEGTVWTFTTTDDNPPEVDAGPDQYVWLDPATVTVTMNGQVGDDGQSELTILWSLDYSEQAPETTVVIDDPDDPLTTVEINGTGLFRFLLEADDALAHDEDAVDIYVTETACDAAKIDPDDHYQTYEFVGDTNDDCEVNIEDLAIMAATWQDCLTDKLGCTR